MLVSSPPMFHVSLVGANTNASGSSPQLDKMSSRPIRQAFIVLFKSCIGVAILGMPFAFRQSGVIVGVLFLVGNAFVTNFTTKLLVACKRNLQETRGKHICSLPEMALALWGPIGLNITNVILLTCQIGNCIAYGIFLSVTSTAVIKELQIFPEHTFGHRSYDSPYFVMTMCW